MDVKWFFLALWRRWWLVLLPPLIVGGVVAYQWLTAPPATQTVYTTVVRFSASQAPDALPNREGDFQDVWLSSELAVKALTSWVQTGSFREQVAARVQARGLDTDLSGLSVAADHERSVGQLFLSWPDADELETIASAALAALQEDSQIYFPQFGREPAQVTILDDVTVTAAPPAIVDRAEPLVQVTLAVLVGLGLAILAEYTDPTLRTQDEVRRAGLEVLVSVPRE